MVNAGRVEHAGGEKLFISCSPKYCAEVFLTLTKQLEVLLVGGMNEDVCFKVIMPCDGVGFSKNLGSYRINGFGLTAISCLSEMYLENFQLRRVGR